MAVTGGIVEAFGPTPDAITVAGDASVVATPIVAGNVVKLSGDRAVAQATTDDVPAGIAMRGCTAQGDEIACAVDGWFYLVADGAITAGQTVTAGATGKVKAGVVLKKVVGVCYIGAADGGSVLVRVRINGAIASAAS
jgi:hypothetical protein